MHAQDRRTNARFSYACNVKAFPYNSQSHHSDLSPNCIEVQLLDLAVHGARFLVTSLGSCSMPAVGDQLVLRSRSIRDDKVFDNMLCEVRWVEDNEFGVRFAMTVDRSDIELLILLVGSVPEGQDKSSHS
ncbi:PilZ domain-containing protein [Desulfovibrio inopinatus]|uniref:PilZ domain-containing protein n=1 Tax=Desulfovibrio inopinatus TaxID=102109 RepID=UPI0004822A6D|nr:PilZ domain-containing protein [Desulfovibrio inopinatus]